ncbi:uncharacterized protein JCM6883_004322 [Sporobolomyces salmoneus]|uniref:uncharacterized protein n=1 Tax=Sporobolomyces salmoneus TaxID=183962 RepID=UPI0031711263
MPPAAPEKKNLVPVAIVSNAPESILLPYASQIIQSLQLLHPHSQIVITCVTPTSHSIPINPFLPPSTFLSSLPSFIRRPTRPASTLWQSTTGMLKAIKLARRRLVQGALAGAGGEGRGQLPKYVVVVSGTDVENPGRDEVSWGEDPGENEEDWETFASNFTKGTHCTTLFSLISLGSTPNLEAFWRKSSGKFPPHLIYNSTSSTTPSGLSFPLLAPNHTCFLIGFYTNRSAQQAQAQAQANSAQASQPPSTSVQTPTNTKRAAPSSPVLNNGAAKKAKPNPNPTPSSSAATLPANSPPNPAGAFLTGNRVQQQPTPPTSTRTIPTPSNLQSNTQSPLQRPSASPSMAPALPSTLTNESLQRYVEEMKAVAAKSGQPPPSAQDIQNAAISAYQAAQRSANGGQSSNGLQSMTPRSSNQPNLPPNQNNQNPNNPNNNLNTANIARELAQMTPQQINALPAIPHEMKVKIEAHLGAIRDKVKAGMMAEEEGQKQVRRLQDLANHQRLKMHQHELAKQQQQNAQSSGLGLNISPQISHSRQPTANNPSNSQQPPPGPKRQDSVPHKTIWRGAISWALTEASGARKDFTIYCEAAPMQSSAARELAEVQLPPTFRINSLSQLKMQVLQELATKNNLPAISLTPMSNSALPPELVEKLKQNGHNNEALYTMFAQSIESRSNCGIVRFSGSSNGLVLVAVPNQNKLLAIVFAKIPLPAEWAQPSSSSSSNSNNAQQQQDPQQHSRTSTGQSIAPPSQNHAQQQPRPPSAQAQSGMFASPASFPTSNLPQQQQQYSSAPQPFAGAKNNAFPQSSFTTNYNPNLNPSPQMMQMQQPQPQPQPVQQQGQQGQGPGGFPAAGVGGMDYSELEKLLGPEQLKLILGGI